MHPAPTPQTPGNDPSGPIQPGTRPILGRIAGVLHVVRTLIAYAQYFTATATVRAATPEFATAAAIFGTYDLAVIGHRMRRGILRALALQRYLIARAARGRNLRFAWPPYVELQPHHRPPARPPRAKPSAPRSAPRPEPSLLGDDDPRAFHIPTDEEFDAEVRRRPVGRTILYICLDLGIAPGLCEGEFWNKVEKILHRYGGSLDRLYRVRARREELFQRERDRLPDTWHIDWRDLRDETVRLALGCRIGQTPPPAPSIVPS